MEMKWAESEPENKERVPSSAKWCLDNFTVKLSFPIKSRVPRVVLTTHDQFLNEIMSYPYKLSTKSPLQLFAAQSSESKFANISEIELMEKTELKNLMLQSL